MASTPNSPPLLAAVKRAILDKYSLIIWFFAINVIVGSAGVWVPLIPEIRHGWNSIFSKLLEVMRSGGGYTFLLAYLAATSGYLIAEYVEESDRYFKSQKAALGAIALVIGLVSAFLTMDLFSGATPIDGLPETTIGDRIQLWMMVIAIVIGFLLALLQWAGAYSLDALLDQSQEEEKSTAKRMMSSARSQGTGKTKNVVDVKGKKVKV